MAIHYEINHVTRYRYANPVSFGEHRAMFLPRLATNGRLLDWSVETAPRSRVRWTSDALANNVTIMEFSEAATELVFTFRFSGVHFGAKGVEQFPLEARAEKAPIQFTPDEWLDLAMFLRPHDDDDDMSVVKWAREFSKGGDVRSVDLLNRMLDSFRADFEYSSRQTEGTQRPGETLRSRSGTCRDFAWLMIEALRRSGFAARFVSGYLYDVALDRQKEGFAGSGSTHAWVQVFLPGAGWTHYDPTNRISAGFDLIPVAIARHPGQAIPLSGGWFGKAQDFLGMTVEVTVSKQTGEGAEAEVG